MKKTQEKKPKLLKQTTPLEIYVSPRDLLKATEEFYGMDSIHLRILKQIYDEVKIPAYPNWEEQ